MNPIHHSRIDIWCQKPNFRDHWVTMEQCDQSRCALRGTCGEYRRLNAAVYGCKGKLQTPDHTAKDISVDDAVEKALQDMEYEQAFDTAAEARIAQAYRKGGASGGREQVRIESRRKQNRMRPVGTGVNRIPATRPQTPPHKHEPVIPRRPKVKAEKRPSHPSKGRGKDIGGRGV